MCAFREDFFDFDFDFEIVFDDLAVSSLSQSLSRSHYGYDVSMGAEGVFEGVEGRGITISFRIDCFLEER